ncbi:unnamed protein product [Caenorhabditis auriculariae]|uniref:Uncharacterized protein n=1 Tax=Caenorhabditis auriculariae TaxID=2777116 RepID=A0A8S1HJJ3_9PELO|nr:unnamed protein product [Caenorhabditis auriculariae]
MWDQGVARLDPIAHILPSTSLFGDVFYLNDIRFSAKDVTVWEASLSLSPDMSTSCLLEAAESASSADRPNEFEVGVDSPKPIKSVRGIPKLQTIEESPRFRIQEVFESRDHRRQSPPCRILRSSPISRLL